MIKNILDSVREKPIRLLILFGIILRVILFSFYRHTSIFPDTEGYTLLASQISGFDLSGYDGMRSPGFPLLISLCGNSLELVVIIQFILGIATSVVLYKNLMALKFERKKALVLTLLLDSLLHVFFYETAILTESFTLFFLTLLYHFILNDVLEKGRLANWMVLSLITGFVVLIKPFYIFLPFLMYGFYVIKNFSLKKIISTRLVLFIFPLLSYLGWSYVNKVNTGYFVPSTLNGFYISQNCVYFAEKTGPEFKQISSIYVKYRTKAIAENDNVSMTIWRAYDELIATTGLSFPDLSNRLNDLSKDAISRNPGAYLNQVFYSWIDFWRPNICWNETEFQCASSAVFFILIWKIQAFALKVFKIAFVLLVLPLLFLQFIRSRQITHELVLAAVTVCASVLQAMATFGTNSRFSYPFEFLMVALVLLQLGRVHSWLSKK